jgi:hypothetical protein
MPNSEYTWPTDLPTEQTLRFACNTTQGVRTERWENREWLVAPVVAIRSGVLNAELVPEDEILNYPQAWNGRPVVVYHPVSATGQPISANSPEVLARQQIGQLFNVSAIRENGAKLKGELWIDVDKAARLGGQASEVLRRLRAAEPLEVSTAYYRETVRESGTWESQEYTSIARNLKPDHLAALPDQIGACSWLDGCGAPRLNMREEPPMNEQAEELTDAEVTQNHEDESVETVLIPNQEDGGNTMSEEIERILTDGRLALNATTLGELAPDVLRGILMTLNALPPAPSAEETEEAPPASAEPAPAINAEDAEAVRALLGAIRDMGGIETVRAAVTDFAANSRQRHETLVGQLVANDACTLSREQLERMDDGQLSALQQMLTPVDYMGLGLTRAPSTGEQELDMPVITWNES